MSEQLLLVDLENIHRFELGKVPPTARVKIFVGQLIGLAKEMRKANARGEALGLSEDELAFYDALETNDSAVKVLGDETLREIARELVQTVRNNVTIDWTIRENVRAQLRVLADPAQARLPAGQAGKGDADRFRAGSIAQRGMGCVASSSDAN
jgi:restriction endonuclease HindI-like protein